MSQPLESPGVRRGAGPFRTLIIAAALLLTAGMALRISPSVAEGARAIPAPVLAEPATQQANSEVAIVAGGCFWGVQGVFQHVEGITSRLRLCRRYQRYGAIRDGGHWHDRTRGSGSNYL